MYGQHKKIPYAGVAAPNRVGIAKKCSTAGNIKF